MATISGTSGDDTLTGTSGNDSISGLGGNDTLNGAAGNDTLDGGVGADSMVGGIGNDAYLVDNVGDVVVENAAEGIDKVYATISYTLAANVENLALTGGSAIDGTGNDLDNVITGHSGANRLTGGIGNDTLNGVGGNDTLDGGVGADSMAGGIGNDSYVVDNAGDIVVENIAEGTDKVYASVSYALAANIENLALTGGAAIDGTGNDLDNMITGNNGANRLTGGIGNDTLNGAARNDTLDGGVGTDSMAGGIGNDAYLVDNAGDIVVENAAEGTDKVYASVSHTLAANVENLALLDGAAIDGTGNDLANLITGNSNGNGLSGGIGNDTLNGVAGNDTLDGGIGADSMAGGIGDDTYLVDNVGDIVVENSGEGTADKVYASISLTLADNVENLELTGTGDINGIGNAGGNIIIGNSGNNQLTGGNGQDMLIGGAGDDTLDGERMLGGTGNDSYIYRGDGPITEAPGEGIDTVYTWVNDYTLDPNIENLSLIFVASRGTGNALDNVITSNSGVGSSLNGADGNDTLIGGAWDDTLIGGNGADSMAGGTKNDSYVVDNAGDVVTEAPGEGIDTVASSISYTLSANVEKLTLSGTASINGTGNDLDNEITGNTGANQLSGGNGHDLLTGLSGNDTLIGGAGNDTLDGGLDQDSMAGGTGDDTYVVERLSDVVTEVAGEGIDTIKTWVSLALPDNVENLWLVDTNAVTGTGNALDNVITGEGGNNVLSGGDGNDTLDGLLGEDTLVGGAGSDSFQFSTAPGTFSFGSNIDVITDFDASQDQIRLSHVFFTALNLGVVDASAFTIGTAATTASQRIVYDDTTGSLYYDADGNGALAAKQVATLVGPTGTLSAGDFLVY